MKKKVLKNVIISLMFVVIICANIAVVSGMPSNKGILLLHVFHPLIGTNSEDTEVWC